eukprot:TRINITY_DN16946_c0_g1_i1.p1 TRINITY_DN16946_c0_g1~~TRINITY_DN16946_c0_g1_i1.p1  ORF type:complete len:1261 (-),score=350.37 TRINITY_DN16946_c0_g1_i1:94-3876(-)
MQQSKRVEVLGRHLRQPKKPQPFREWVTDHYVSPYTVEQCPLDAVVLYNPSLHANNVAIEDLLSVWPKLPIIQTVQEGRRLAVGVHDHVPIPKSTWGKMDVFERCWNEYILHHAWLRGKKVGFYPMWSPMAEDSAVARAVLKMGLHWVGAAPAAMDGLGKIEYKRFCQANGMPTADFFELSVSGVTDHEEACKRMTDKYFELVKGTALEGHSCFVKSDFGGGGRGTKKVPTPDRESIYSSIRKVVAETGKTDLIYAELALDLRGAQLYQMEMEADAGNLVDGGRLVYFNARNQKMVELGFSSEEVVKFIPAGVYKECQRCAELVARLSKYDGRGTNEILIVHLANGEWKIFNSEFNKRIQVEHKALAHLKRYHDGHLFNTVADQLMRSCGYPPPDYLVDLLPSGHGAVGHVRLISPQITATGDIMFPAGVIVDSLLLPKGFTATIDIGPLFSDTDAQFGAVVALGNDWQDLIRKLQFFAAETVVFGQKIRRDYFLFLQKFFHDQRVANMTLSCNKTFDVLSNAVPAETRTVQVANYLSNSVAELLVNSWRPEAGVPNRPYPTAAQISEFEELQSELNVMPVVRRTPFEDFLQHLDEERYFRDLKAQLNVLGGGMVSIFPRDVQQESGGSESHLIAGVSRMIMERLGAACGYFGLEIGGAQYQTAEMIRINSALVQEKSICCNMMTHSLTRAHWVNALEILSPAQIRYVLLATANMVRKAFNLPMNCKIVPYHPYNFHAGNVEEQDVVTAIMLEVGMTPIPTFSWDPRFTAEHFDSWLQRQYGLWHKAGRTLHHLRVKNAGQTKDWTAERIFSHVQQIRDAHKRAYGPDAEPIVQIHNHNFNGNAAHTVRRALDLCQAAGYNLLLIDTAPPAMTHNDNLVITKSLRLTPEQRRVLNRFNEACHITWQLSVRFQDFSLINTDPDTIWAGGTGSSDQIAARKLGLENSDVEPAKFLGAQVTGIGAIVTPYSQWSMVTGYNCYKQGFRTFDEVLKHIEGGGTLNLPRNILLGLYEWRTLLPKPAHVKKLIANHMRQDPALFKEAGQARRVFPPFDVEAIKKQIIAVAPHRVITELDVSRVIQYGNFAIKTIEAEALAKDMNWAIYLPHIAFARSVPVGAKFTIFGLPVVYAGREEVPNTADVVITYGFKGQWIRVTTKDVVKQKLLEGAGKGPEILLADPANPNHVGAPMPGMIEALYAKVGQPIKAGDQLYAINSMKMVTVIKAGPEHAGKVVANIYVKKGEELSFSADGKAPLVMALAPASK